MTIYLVTGGGGFIGSNIVEAILEQGHQVRVLDNFSTGKRENLIELKQVAHFKDHLEVYEGDLRNYDLIQDVIQNVDYVLHQGALPSVPRSIHDPITTNEVNLVGTLNLLQAARQAEVKRFVFASSSSVYGDTPALPKVETLCPAPLSPYAITKIAGEQYCRNFWQLYGFETVCLRYFNVFGPRQDPTSQYSAVIPKFITALLDNRKLTIFGNGKQSRDFTFVANVVQANLLACTAQDVQGKTFNVACGERYTILELVMWLEQFTGRKAIIQYTEPRPGDVLHSQADISQARTKLTYQPDISFEDGLRRTVEYFLRKL